MLRKYCWFIFILQNDTIEGQVIIQHHRTQHQPSISLTELQKDNNSLHTELFLAVNEELNLSAELPGLCLSTQGIYRKVSR